MGAWIEIIKLGIRTIFVSVAPFMGAWIEIPMPWLSTSTGLASHPSWVRGLKFAGCRRSFYPATVAPFMGPWIEITWRLRLVRILTSLTFHGKKEC